MNRKDYSIARDYTRKPGPRYEWQGDYSGENFRETILLDLFDSAVKNNSVLFIDLDKTAGFGPSFLEEAFGGLARKRDRDLIHKHLRFISTEEPYLIGEVKGYIDAKY